MSQKPSPQVTSTSIIPLALLPSNAQPQHIWIPVAATFTKPPIILTSMIAMVTMNHVVYQDSKFRVGASSWSCALAAKNERRCFHSVNKGPLFYLDSEWGIPLKNKMFFISSPKHILSGGRQNATHQDAHILIPGTSEYFEYVTLCGKRKSKLQME